MSKKETDENRAAAMKSLKRLKPGTTIYYVVTHVARSGMQRSIEFYIPTTGTEHMLQPDGTYRDVRRPVIERITWEIAQVLGYRIDQRNGGLIVGGCGMDMGFHCVYTLGHRLWPKGTRKPHSRRNGQPDSDGGYALKARQM